MNTTKYLLLCIAIILMFSCSNEERNRLPSITPSHIDLSPEHPEAYFQIACGDYNMSGFIIVGQEEYRITKEIMSKEVTVVELSDGSKATFHCRNRILVKIDFGFMTISKIQRGKYKVQLNKNIDIRQPIAISFGFSVPGGISTVVVTLKQ